MWYFYFEKIILRWHIWSKWFPHVTQATGCFVLSWSALFPGKVWTSCRTFFLTVVITSAFFPIPLCLPPPLLWSSLSSGKHKCQCNLYKAQNSENFHSRSNISISLQSMTWYCDVERRVWQEKVYHTQSITIIYLFPFPMIILGLPFSY